VPEQSNTPVLTADQVRALLRYDPLTGKLFWRKRPLDMCPSVGQWKRWNSRWTGKEAFTAVDTHGYLKGTIFAQVLRAHRVIWLMETGAWPDADIDHVNGDRTDNRIENLRDVSRSQNRRNSALSSSNSSGVTGVFRLAEGGKWTARIFAYGRTVSLGTFDTIEAAKQAREEANKKYGYSSRHGT